ncbi:hypothetical protein F8S13_25565 [Chloroflexia bacterium SDU3-3]|nr:hypothetical protein F8S13_25565 [Chloroflexia bacterium SDU3-3]
MDLILSQRGRRLLIIIGGGVLVLALAFLIGRMRAPQPAAADPGHPAAQASSQGRTLVIVPRGQQSPAISGEGGVLFASLISGAAPKSGAAAVVRTDENCTPDAQGVSHCINALALGEAQLVVQHHHDMAQVPCLSPGESITLITLADYQAQS